MVGFFNIEDDELPIQEIITPESVEEVASIRPRRICFVTTHAGALKMNSSECEYYGKFSLPFEKTVKPIFEESTGMKLFPSRFGGCWVSLRTESEFISVKQWIDAQGSRVFLRDTMALSVALSEHISEASSRTKLGELEYRAKYRRGTVRINAINELANICFQAMQELPFYKDGDITVAVPPRQGKAFDLPTEIVRHLTSNDVCTDLSQYLTWQAQKKSLKTIPVERKWVALERAELEVSYDFSDQTVILIDDLYQSGVTMQYVAMKLQQAGAKKIYGMALVKSRRDTDNR